jgi:catalase-peroxidase
MSAKAVRGLPTSADVSKAIQSRSTRRALYRPHDAKDKFVADFVAAWNKLMNLDRSDLA